MTQFNELYKPAIIASIEASKIIMEVYRSSVEINIKADGSPVTQADLAASKIISSHLSSTGIPIMGEELKKKDFSVRSQWTKNWCVDPLDGTKMFIEKNDEFVVNIALVENNEAIFGLIASPVQERIIIGGKGIGVYIFDFNQKDDFSSWRKILPFEERNDPLIVTCSRSFGKNNIEYAARIEKEYGDFSYLKMGSAIKFFELAEGNADMYVRLHPTMEWDIAAGQAILEELGGEIRNLDTNESLKYNKESLFNPSFIAKTKALL